ncbi:MAG: CPBP family intramembrane metalloprotease [Flavobacteriales bacterium]|nr:CPBP family intramembrane metalloprotease [Flavobacteriales bacterium]
MNLRKIGLFLLFAFGISWLSSIGLYFSGIEYGSGLSIFIIAVFYMTGPAISTLIVQRLFYKEGIEKYGWRWKTIKWKWMVGTIIISILFILGTMGVIGIFGNGVGIESFGIIDFSSGSIKEKIVETVMEKMKDSDLPVNIEDQISKIPLSAVPFMLILFATGIVAAFTVNLPFMFGEELGWRGLLLKETQQLGFLKSNLLIGLLWGLWHAPIILMGHNYPEYPVIGVGLMVVFTTVLAFPFAYTRFKTDSLLGPCVMHGMINGTAATLLYFTWGGHSLVTGITGVAGFIAISIIVIGIFAFDKAFVRNYRDFE